MIFTEEFDWDFGSCGTHKIEVGYIWVAPSDGGFDEPPTSEDWSIEWIKVGGRDILWMFEDSALDEVVEVLKERSYE